MTDGQTRDERECLERADQLISEGVSGDKGLIASMIYEAVIAEREACAMVIVKNQEGSSSDARRRYVSERYPENLAGLAYADAIRARGAQQ